MNDRPLVSVVMPVYNECQTVEQVIDDLLGRTFDGFDIELIIVESNSSDGTREVVRKYEPLQRVRVILQARADGKGAAVREGLLHVHGDIVLIQDADLEYDISDYPALIEPIIAGDADVVLGNRGHHDGPIRSMDDEVISSALTNFGHALFAGLFNIVYGQSLRDPFTMYKVFRVECIDGMTFSSNRFDFDWELLARLCRRGYRPLEVPVHYKARGFLDGKKVRWLRDPVSWIWAAIKYRLVKP
jgi:glycosyltransferase involved in cell wall biosynthesis